MVVEAAPSALAAGGCQNRSYFVRPRSRNDLSYADVDVVPTSLGVELPHGVERGTWKSQKTNSPTSGAVVLAAGDYDELILLLNCHQSISFHSFLICFSAFLAPQFILAVIMTPAPTSGSVVLAAGDDDELILLLNCHQFILALNNESVTPTPTSGSVVLAAGNDDELILLLNCHQCNTSVVAFAKHIRDWQVERGNLIFKALTGWFPSDENAYPKASHVGYILVLVEDGKCL
nr:arginine--tRNA ligase, cytoplasmic-like isoform X1 [Ipomoea trifida]